MINGKNVWWYWGMFWKFDNLSKFEMIIKKKKMLHQLPQGTDFNRCQKRKKNKESKKRNDIDPFVKLKIKIVKKISAQCFGNGGWGCEKEAVKKKRKRRLKKLKLGTFKKRTKHSGFLQTKCCQILSTN